MWSHYFASLKFFGGSGSVVNCGPRGGTGGAKPGSGVQKFWGPLGASEFSAICGRLAALILRLRPAGLRFEEFRSPVKRGGLGLRFSNRSGLRPVAI